MKSINKCLSLLVITASVVAMDKATISKSQERNPIFIEKLRQGFDVDPNILLKEADEFLELNKSNNFYDHACKVRELTSTLLNPITLNPAFPNYPKNDQEAKAFFNYLETHPQFATSCTDDVIAVRNFYLNYLVKRSTVKMPLCLVMAAVNLGADDWLAPNINNIGIQESVSQNDDEKPYAFEFSPEYVNENNMKAILEKHRPGSLDKICALLKSTPGVKFQEKMKVYDIPSVWLSKNDQ